jgi:hypothetical protein
MSGTYTIKFNDGTNIVYNLLDGPIVDQWKQCTRYYQSNPGSYVSSVNVKSDFTGLTIEDHWNQLIDLVSQVNQDSSIQERGLQLDVPSSITQYENQKERYKIINYLHLKFHELEEKENIHMPALVKLNNLIHRIEQVNNGSKEKKVFVSYYLRNDNVERFIIPIDLNDDNLRQYWTQQASSGDLLLGYHTVGKNLWHCYVTDDSDCVRQGMVRPQECISAEVQMVFATNDWHFDRSHYYQKIPEWLKENNIGSDIIELTGAHTAFYFPILGKLTPESQAVELPEISRRFLTGISKVTLND